MCRLNYIPMYALLSSTFNFAYMLHNFETFYYINVKLHIQISHWGVKCTRTVRRNHSFGVVGLCLCVYFILYPYFTSKTSKCVRCDVRYTHKMAHTSRSSHIRTLLHVTLFCTEVVFVTMIVSVHACIEHVRYARTRCTLPVYIMLLIRLNHICLGDSSIV